MATFNATGVEITVNFEPIDDRVLVRPDEEKGVTSGGIIIPDSAKDRAEAGTVVAVGPGDWNLAGTARKPLMLQVGDRVAFGRYAGTAYKLDGVEHFIMREAEVFGKLPVVE